MSEWTQDEDGCWRCPVGDGSIEVELYPDEMADWPPLVALRAEVDRLTAERDVLTVESRLEASWWRHIAWMNGYPRDSDDIHQWETIDEYRTVLNDERWTTPHRPERAAEGRQG